MAFELTLPQKTAMTARNGALLVAAAAGAGKTRVLTERLMENIFVHGAHVDSHLAVTYTRAAARELRRRIGDELSARARLSEGGAKGRAARELLRLNRAQIGTIHAFCAALIRRFSVECGVRPDFRQLDESEAAELRARALNEALESLYASCDGGSPFGALAASLSDTGRDRRLADTVVDVYTRLRALPEPDAWMDAQLAALRDACDLPPERTVWGAYLLEEAQRELGLLQTLMQDALTALTPVARDAYGPAVASDLENIGALARACQQGWDAAVTAFAAVAHARLKPLKNKEDYPDALQFADTRDRYKKAVSKMAERLSLPSEQARAEFEATLPYAEGLFTAVREFGGVYKSLKERRGALDFQDLEHIARRLLINGGANVQAAALFDEILVDEYQDVNQVQEDILNALADGGARLFLVGDARQSVYGFRQADPSIFTRKYDDWPAAASNQPQGRVVLPHNFRSHPMLLEAVNGVFSGLMAQDALQPPPGTDTDADSAPRAELWMYQRGDHENEGDGEYGMAAEIALRVLADGKFTPSDIAVLTRTHGQLEFYRRALIRRGIPVAAGEGADGGIEFQAVLACAQTMDNPRRDMPLLTLTRLPPYNCAPAELAEIRAQSRGCLYDALTAASENGHPKAAKICADVAYLRALAADTPMPQVFHAMLERLELPVSRALMPLIPIAAKCGSVAAFCDALARMDKTAEEVSTSAGVTLCTMHKSKGLEFPVVIAAGLHRTFNRDSERKPVLFHRELGAGFKLSDPELRVSWPTMSRQAAALKTARESEAEELRLLYVTLTRAREYLYVTTSGNPRGGMPQANRMSDWLAALPSIAWTAKTVNSEQITDNRYGCEAKAEATPHTPVPHLLSVICSLLSVNLPSKITVTELLPGADLPVFPRPRFMEGHVGLTAAERGTALHEVMRQVVFARCRDLDGVRGELERLARERRISAARVAAVDAARVLAFVNSPLGRQAAASPDCRRELPFSLLVKAKDLPLGDGVEVGGDDEILLQGMIDLLFLDNNGWTLVDFKTGRIQGNPASAPAEAALRYAPQMNAYAYAAARISGLPVNRKVIWFTDGDLAIDN